MVSSILEMAELAWPVPDFSTLSRRQKSISVGISSRRAPGPLNLLVDSTGIKFLGDGEWLARKHGTHRRRQYRKVHLAMDTAPGDIRAVEFTSSREGDSPILPDLLDQIPPGSADRHRDRRWCLRHPPLPRRNPRSWWQRHHTHPQERAPLEGGLPCREGAQ